MLDDPIRNDSGIERRMLLCLRIPCEVWLVYPVECSDAFRQTSITGQADSIPQNGETPEIQLEGTRCQIRTARSAATSKQKISFNG